jgi:hypothetical protein
VRTGTESHDSLAVLDGEEDLDLFVNINLIFFKKKTLFRFLKAGLLSLGTSKAM